MSTLAKYNSLGVRVAGSDYTFDGRSSAVHESKVMSIRKGNRRVGRQAKGMRTSLNSELLTPESPIIGESRKLRANECLLV